MKYLLVLFGISTAIFAGCARTCSDTTLYQGSGRQKPIVAVLPVICDVTDESINWDLSREFTDEIRKRIFDSSHVYLLREGGSSEIAELLNRPDPAQLSATTAKALGAAEFVVVSELIEQKETPYGIRRVSSDKPFVSEMGSLLTLAMRVRVLDVRHDKPKVILQEIINHEHVIARPYMHCNYAKAPWGTEAFERTPMGIAHMRLVRELTGRVESYIEVSR